MVSLSTIQNIYIYIHVTILHISFSSLHGLLFYFFFKRFKTIDADVKKILKTAENTQFILYACNVDGLYDELEEIQERLSGTTFYIYFTIIYVHLYTSKYFIFTIY